MDKFICKHCNFSLNIKKASNIQVVKINTSTEFVNAIKSEEVQEYDINIERADLENFLKKKKEEERNRILERFDTILQQKRTATKFILKCSTCGSDYPLYPGTVIYSLNFRKQQSSFNDDFLDLKLQDPTLPRTKDYICPYDDCETNDKNFDTAKKEAVFYRAKGSYHLKYACCNCERSWAV
jgi:hypothetical protein